MELISDILLIVAAATAGIYCIVLSRRLSRFSDLDQGVGGAIAILSAQVDDMTRNLQAAQNSAGDSSQALLEVTERAESASRKLELMVASLHDLPSQTARKAEPVPLQTDAEQEQSQKEVSQQEPAIAAEVEPDPVFKPRIRFGAAE